MKNTIVIFVFLICLIYICKPNFIFKNEGGVYTIREYGIGGNDGDKKTLFNMNNIVLLLVFISIFIDNYIA